MSQIKTVKTYVPKRPNGQKVLLLCGFGGSIWQTQRLTRTLLRAGYYVTALDFPETVLGQGDPKLLPALVDEVVTFAENEAKSSQTSILLVGISLGALISLNILRRSDLFQAGIGITGGDIVTVAQNIYGPKIWPQSYDELAVLWQKVNMYTDPAKLSDKRLLFVLPTRDKLIDPNAVRKESQRQQAAGNKMLLIERRPFGHVGTIIEETIIFPGRILSYIKKVNAA